MENANTKTTKLKVGDKVIGQNFVINLDRNGEHGTVTEILGFGRHTVKNDVEHGYRYFVTWADGDKSTILARCLRKKPSGRAKKLAKDFGVLSSWELVGWAPKKEVVA